jgi:arylsulfatase A-like enzyme
MNLSRFFRIAISATSVILSVAASGAAEQPPNVLIFLADDYGAMDMGAANPKTFYETPNLDRFAAQSVRFTSGYSANPVCSPTRYSLQTGKYPTRAGLTNFLAGVRAERFEAAPLTREMPLEDTTLAEILQPAGYRTAFVGKWHLGEQETFWPEANGYEFNVGGFSRGSPPSYFSPYKNPRLKDGPPGEHLTARLADETVALLERFKSEGKPFLINHCFYDVHTPLRAPAELIEKYRAKAQRLGLQDAFVDETQHFISVKEPRRVRSVQCHPVYAAMVESMDTAFGRIVRKLDELGLAESTLVVFMSDNGGLSTSEGSPTSNLPLRAGKGWVYEGGIRVPFLVRMPGAAKPGTTSDVPVMSTDIFATALDFVGARLPAGAMVDGLSLAPLLRGGAVPARDALYWHFPHYGNQGGFPGGAIRMGEWKLIENYEDGSVQLYHLRDDIGERTDLASAQKERVNAMRAKLHAWYRETGAKFLRAKADGPQPWKPGE